MLTHMRFIVMLLTILLLAGCSEEPQNRVQPKREEPVNIEMKTIVAIGDSLTAGFGVDPSESYPALLEKKLQAHNYPYTVVNAGVSGETSSGTLARIDWILTRKPELVIVGTGANDGLRGISVNLLEENLREIVTQLKENNVAVLLAGMKMVYNLGPEYVSQFNAVYPRIAQEMEVELMPFFLEDVATRTNLNLEDGIHPNSEGYRIIVENIYPYVVEVLDSVKQ
ncbi:arylesterase [Desulforhopalus sp. IMCC35007]|uniref:arylesterase n=1 Tax=Desulforhopalus sp. IMCC35007 TaxID=2569543 RepID=UPI0010AE8A8A|nr:arylesterase [Desulforhopalus sp. IMCC35007]TKB08162.1 arylesterase [Desulforhopalus sp. IMCC35007]